MAYRGANRLLLPNAVQTVQVGSLDEQLDPKGSARLTLNTYLRPIITVSYDQVGGNGQNAVIRLHVEPKPDSGAFTLSFLNEVTSNIPFNVNAAQLSTILIALSVIGPDDFEVTGGPFNVNDIIVTAKPGGQYANANVPLFVAEDRVLGTEVKGWFPDSLKRYTIYEAMNNYRFIVPLWNEVYFGNITDATGGSYTVRYRSSNVTIFYNDTAEQIQTKFRALTTIGPDVDVVNNKGTMVVRFKNFLENNTHRITLVSDNLIDTVAEIVPCGRKVQFSYTPDDKRYILNRSLV